ncbi:MAG: histidine phosphatase family protein, partial [Acidimicrobiales bacterium]
MDLLIIRHGRPERVEGAEGTADPGLTDIGHDQALAVARFLADEPVDHIVSSPMLRARQTAEPLSQILQLPVQVIDDLAEIDKDAQEYVPIEERRADAGE